MTDSNPNAVVQPQQTFDDLLPIFCVRDARELIVKAVEAELQIFLEQHSLKKLLDGCQALVRNGYLSERTVQTGIGDVQVEVPKVRDRSGDGMCFNSQLLPPYLKGTKSAGAGFKDSTC